MNNILVSFVLFFLFSSTAFSGSWKSVQESSGKTSGWIGIECKEGTGWQPCVAEPKKVRECRHDKWNKIYEKRPAQCNTKPDRCWPTIMWDGKDIAIDARVARKSGTLKKSGYLWESPKSVAYGAICRTPL